MSWLLDTNVVSEVRKGARAHENVARWYAMREGELWLSVLTVGEIRRGIEAKRRRDPESAEALEWWLEGLTGAFGARILPVDARVADVWGRLNVPNPLPAVDGLLAATAIVHGLTLVTRNTADIARTGVSYLDPFSWRG